MTMTQHSSPIPAGLPELDADSLEHQQAVHAYLVEQIQATQDGFMPFEQWMHLALYAPGLGYYAAGNTKFGAVQPEGDFTTAPELSPLFGQALAKQAAEVLQACESANVLEFGAGSGALAASIIPALRALGIEPNYQILEVSADLRARQQQALASFGPTVTWLDVLPDQFRGCVLANEVLDAMPATLFHWAEDDTVNEMGVVLTNDTKQTFTFAERAAPSSLQETISQRMPPLPGYQSEINLQAEAWVRQMGEWLEKGAALLIDYGFPRHEYYHPQRATGTLMCHFRHHAHSQPLIYAGLQDITTHVDFTAMADAALDGGMHVLGYTSQARFLMNTGLPELLLQALGGTAAGDQMPQEPGPSAAIAATRSLAAVQKLLSEAEMGELFKVLAIGRGIEPPLLGFERGDRRDRL